MQARLSVSWKSRTNSLPQFISNSLVDTKPNNRLERTRHERASLVSCVGEPLKRSVRCYSFFESYAIGKTIFHCDCFICACDVLQRSGFVRWCANVVHREQPDKSGGNVERFAIS